MNFLSILKSFQSGIQKKYATKKELETKLDKDHVTTDIGGVLDLLLT